MEKILFDSHAHMNHEDTTAEERAELVSLIENSAIAYMMDMGFDIPSSIMAAEHAEKYPWCFAAVGCHPHDTDTMDEEKLEIIRNLAAKDKVVAIGEIGLDFHYDDSPRDVQREWFRRQIRLALELRMPIAVHAREADAEVMEILESEGAFGEERLSAFPARPVSPGHEFSGCTRDARVLLHCFSGSAELGREYVRKGATISVAGPVTFKNNKKTVRMVEEIPLDFLLIETDSPYLTPVPFRGKKNIPPFVEHTARKIAEIKGISYEEAAAATRNNALRFYGI